MEGENVFAAVTQTPEMIAARVRRDLTRDDADGPPGVDLERAAEDAVHDLWDSRIKTFVPVLALRAAREALAEGTGAAET